MEWGWTRREFRTQHFPEGRIEFGPASGRITHFGFRSSSLCRFPVIVFQHPADPLPALDPADALAGGSSRFYQPISESLVIPFLVVVLDKLGNGIP